MFSKLFWICRYTFQLAASAFVEISFHPFSLAAFFFSVLLCFAIQHNLLLFFYIISTFCTFFRSFSSFLCSRDEYKTNLHDFCIFISSSFCVSRVCVLFTVPYFHCVTVCGISEDGWRRMGIWTKYTAEKKCAASIHT